MALRLAPAAVVLAGFALGPGDARAAVPQAADPDPLSFPSLFLEQESRRQDPSKERAAPEGERAVRFGAEFWFVTIRGDLESAVSGVTDTKFSLTGEAGMDEGLVWKLFVDFAPSSDCLFRISYRHLDESGSKALGRQVVFDGKTFPIGSQVSSDLRIDWYGLEARFPARLDPKDRFQGQAVVSFYVLDAEVELSGAPGRGRQSYSLEFLDAGFDAKALLLESVFVGGNFSVAWAVFDKFIGGELGLKGGYLSSRVAVEGGYRWWAIGGAINDEPDLDLRFKGPYLSALVRF